MAELRPHYIDVDLKKNTQYNVPVVTQNDTATHFIIRVTDDGLSDPELLDAYQEITMTSQRPDGESFYLTGSRIAGTNEIEFHLGTDETAFSGSVLASLQFYLVEDASRYTSAQFRYDVKKDLTTNYTPTQREETLVEVVLRDGPGVIREAREAIQAADSAIVRLDEVTEENKTVFRQPVATFAALSTTYPNPEHGTTVRVTGESATYRYSDGSWVKTDEYNPTAIDQVAAQLAETDAEAKRKKGLNDLTPEVLAAIEGGEGTTFNLLSIPEDDSVTSEKLDQRLRDDLHKQKRGVNSNQSEISGFKGLASNLGYERNETSNTPITTGTIVSDMPITSTFAGFAAPLHYSGEKFDTVSVYVITEDENANLRCYIMDSKRNILTSQDATATLIGASWVDFKFDSIVDEQVLQEDVFYVGVATLNRFQRLATAKTSPSSQLAANSDTLKTYYTTLATTGAGRPDSHWIASSSSPGTILLAEFKNSTEPIIEYQKSAPMIATLPPKLEGVVGKELNIYFDNVLSGYYEDYLIDVTCSIGKQQNERWTVMPTSAGVFDLSITLYDKYNYKEVSRKSTKITIANNSAGGSVAKSALFFGSSTTASGSYTSKILELFDADVMDISLIGTKGSGSNKHEGIGGWTYAQFAESVDSPFVFDGIFDFEQYLTVNSFDVPDYVFFQSGINDVFSANTDESLTTRNNVAIGHMENMISKIKEQYPTMKIGVILTYPSSSQDGFGTNYANGQTAWRYKRNGFLAFNEMINQLKGRESEGVYIVPVHTNIDTRNNMQTEEIQVNSRNTKLVSRHSNGIHIAESGYWQLADSVYYWMKSLES